MQGLQAKRYTLRPLHVCAAIAALAGAACLGDAASAMAGEADAAVRAHAAERIEIAPLEAARSADAAVFSTYLTQETSRGGLLPFRIGGALGAGEGGTGTYLVAVIDIADEAGRPLHRLISETTLDGSAIDERALRRFAAETAGRIAQWYAAFSPGPAPGLAGTPAANETIVTGSIDAPKPRAFNISIGPAPGDGAAALTRALDAELQERSKNNPWLTARNFSIEGSVTTASRSDGRTDVSIHWLVKSADGRKLGEIHQKNALDAARIAGRWGEVAQTAARAAADGVAAVLQPAPERLAANG
ncbi:MAG: hypothetical protein LPK88_13250 [Alphaproteobacteria bacterium]|nr:hypothetical protein [Alphaproteobacteria bacterium]MDX5417267.1 hypothetical protein [Alphaproteobacteria bacterium]MDX5494714.1 hypothetical protein [Alphaproteobacteria bacterium]